MAKASGLITASSDEEESKRSFWVTPNAFVSNIIFKWMSGCFLVRRLVDAVGWSITCSSIRVWKCRGGIGRLWTRLTFPGDVCAGTTWSPFFLHFYVFPKSKTMLIVSLFLYSVTRRRPYFWIKKEVWIFHWISRFHPLQNRLNKTDVQFPLCTFLYKLGNCTQFTVAPAWNWSLLFMYKSIFSFGVFTVLLQFPIF